MDTILIALTVIFTGISVTGTVVMIRRHNEMKGTKWLDRHAAVYEDDPPTMRERLRGWLDNQGWYVALWLCADKVRHPLLNYREWQAARRPAPRHAAAGDGPEDGADGTENEDGGELVPLPVQGKTVPVARTESAPPWDDDERLDTMVMAVMDEEISPLANVPDVIEGEVVTHPLKLHQEVITAYLEKQCEELGIPAELMREERAGIPEIIVPAPNDTIQDIISDGAWKSAAGDSGDSEMTIILDGRTIVQDGKPVLPDGKHAAAAPGGYDPDHSYLTEADMRELGELLDGKRAGIREQVPALFAPSWDLDVISDIVPDVIPTPIPTPHDQWTNGALINPRSDWDALASEILASSSGTAMLALESLAPSPVPNRALSLAVPA